MQFAWPALDADTIRMRSRILVIDDHAFAYKKLFIDGGYAVTKWNDVKNPDALTSGQFDLILLDLQGVGLAQSNEQGLGVLKHIKTVDPGQLVIAYSNAEFPLGSQPFFDMADAVLQKSADFLDFKREVDRLLTLRFSESFYVERMRSEILRTGGKPPPSLERDFRRSLGARDLGILRQGLQRDLADGPTLERVLLIAQTALTLVQVLQGA